MQTPIRLGLIGCGGIVQLQHLPTLCELDTVRIVALADPDDDNLTKVGATTGVPPAQRYADYRDMLEQAAIDAVLIATPHHLHAEQVIAAAEAGCTVISEKPMATSLEEGSAVLDAVARHDVIYTVVHNAVFTPGTLHAIALLQGDELPEPQVGRAKSLFPMTEAHHRANPARIWRASKAAGGGCIGDTGYHEIYSLETLMCSPVRYVEARVQTRFFDIDVDDVALLLLEHENGAISTVSTSWGMVGGGAGELGGLCEVHTSRRLSARRRSRPSAASLLAGDGQLVRDSARRHGAQPHWPRRLSHHYVRRPSCGGSSADHRRAGLSQPQHHRGGAPCHPSAPRHRPDGALNASLYRLPQSHRPHHRPRAAGRPKHRHVSDAFC